MPETEHSKDLKRNLSTGTKTLLRITDYKNNLSRSCLKRQLLFPWGQVSKIGVNEWGQVSKIDVKEWGQVFKIAVEEN